MNVQIKPYYCTNTQTDVILCSDRIKPDPTNEWLIIGYPGVDGIEFRMRQDGASSSVFAFYPIDDENIQIAESPENLIKKWKSNELVL